MKAVPLDVVVADLQSVPALDVNHVLCTALMPVGDVVIRPVGDFLCRGRAGLLASGDDVGQQGALDDFGSAVPRAGGVEDREVVAGER